MQLHIDYYKNNTTKAMKEKIEPKEQEVKEETIEDIENQFAEISRKLIANSPSKKYRILSNDEFSELKSENEALRQSVRGLIEIAQDCVFLLDSFPSQTQ